jgi:pimeloyl-ACP methyl ester carboxylesterase
LTFSYLDSGGTGDLIVALHAMWMEARTFELFGRAMTPDWRVVTLDQRGHGHSGHASDYSRAAYIGDIGALLDHLGVSEPVILVGNSLGGRVLSALGQIGVPAPRMHSSATTAPLSARRSTSWSGCRAGVLVADP